MTGGRPIRAGLEGADPSAREALREARGQRRDDEALRAAVAQIELLQSRTPAGIFHADAVGRPVFVNEMLCAMTGMPPDQLANGGWIDAVHPEDRERVAAGWKAAWEAGATFHCEFRLAVGGESRWIFTTAKPLSDEEGRYTGAVGVVIDVTEARVLEERLARAERLASVGALASGMAHEVNNPLACVVAGLSFASEELAARPELAEVAAALAEARLAAGRVARIVRELQAFSGARDEIERLDLRRAVEGAVPQLAEELRHRAQLELRLGEAPPVEASAAQLERVLLHLLANAFQAVPEGRPGTVQVATFSAPDGRAALEIRDDGRGIAPEHLRRIFEPFFTTREAGQGAGLGLSACHGLVAAMAGEMEVESEVGRGSTFRVLLPAARESAPISAAPSPSPVPLSTEGAEAAARGVF